MSALPKYIEFEGAQLSVIDRNGKPWLHAADLARALDYKQANQISRIYARNQDEFSGEMSDRVSLTLSGNLQTETRIFSPRGCYLVGMLAKTEKAKTFRRWVLDVLEKLSRDTTSWAITKRIGDDQHVNLISEIKMISRQLRYSDVALIEYQIAQSLRETYQIADLRQLTERQYFDAMTTLHDKMRWVEWFSDSVRRAEQAFVVDCLGLNQEPSRHIEMVNNINRVF